jgi:hypothetical protein
MKIIILLLGLSLTSPLFAQLFGPNNFENCVIDVCNFDEPIVSDMTGRGFYHRNLHWQLAKRCGIDKDY